MLHRTPRWKAALVSWMGVACSLVPAGCASRTERLCDEMCDCTGCSEARYVECLDKASLAEQTSNELGCAAKLDAYFGCFREELECRNDVFSADGCETEERELLACGVSVFRTVCELANEHQLNECRLGQFPGGSDNCTGQVECQARCTLETSCAGLTGVDPLEIRRFNDCLNQCFVNGPQK